MLHPLYPEPERAARNQSLRRAVNDRIHELCRLPVGPDAAEYLCECVDLSCPERVAVSREEYRRVRRHPADFIVAPGHEQPQLEEVVSKGLGWAVVRKLRVGALLAAEPVPR
jgi:hypothetical protein